MPIYEYRCTACGHELEALQKISEPLLINCPSCHQDALAKQLSAAGFQLKGSGWYATDFRNGSKPAAKPKPEGESKGAESKSEAPAESAKSGTGKSESGKSDSGMSDSKAATSTTA